MRGVLLVFAATLVAGCNDSSLPGNETHSPPSPAESHASEGKTGGAIRAVDDALAGKTVSAAAYGTTEDEIFEVFKAKIAQISQSVRQSPGGSGLASAKSDSQRLLRAMERVNPDRADTIEFRKMCKEVGFVD